MIGKLSGYVSCFEDHVIVDVSGVGYLVFCSIKTLSSIAENSYQQLFIETHVRDDHIHLYGFISLEEKHTFNLLQSVNGIGPRMALTILSSMTPTQIWTAVSVADKAAFKAISGVGSKLAERMLIELKDRLPFDSAVNHVLSSNIASDAISALINLGRSKVEAQNIVTQILNAQPNIQINELIRLALKNRG